MISAAAAAQAAGRLKWSTAVWAVPGSRVESRCGIGHTCGSAARLLWRTGNRRRGDMVGVLGARRVAGRWRSLARQDVRAAPRRAPRPHWEAHLCRARGTPTLLFVAEGVIRTEEDVILKVKQIRKSKKLTKR